MNAQSIITIADVKTRKEYIVIHAWKNGGAISTCEVIEKREKSMRLRNLDNGMEFTAPYSGLKSMGDAAKEYVGSNNYYPAQWWVASDTTSNYVHKALGRLA